jgi:hypothetical protein
MHPHGLSIMPTRTVAFELFHGQVVILMVE